MARRVARLLAGLGVAGLLNCAGSAPPAAFATQSLSPHYQYLAPDRSEIRLLLKLDSGELSHCTLPAGAISTAVRHRTVEEIWYVIDGQGELWRRQDGYAEIVPMRAGTALTIPVGTEFQFRNLGTTPLTVAITTLPPWPGPAEAVPVSGYWPIDANPGAEEPAGVVPEKNAPEAIAPDT